MDDNIQTNLDDLECLLHEFNKRKMTWRESEVFLKEKELQLDYQKLQWEMLRQPVEMVDNLKKASEIFLERK